MDTMSRAPYRKNPALLLRMRRSTIRSNQVVPLLLAVGLVFPSLTGCTGAKPESPQFDPAHYNDLVRQHTTATPPEEPASPPPEMNADEHERLADGYAQQGNYPLALTHYSKTLEQETDRIPARLKLGSMYLKQGLWEAARIQFQETIARAPMSGPAYEGMGHALLMMKQDQQAEPALRKAISLAPDRWQAYNLLGLLLDRQKRHREAIEAYQAALTRQPAEAAVHNNLGLALFFDGQPEAAAQEFQRALLNGATQPKVFNNLALAYARLEHYPEALEAFKKATNEPQAYYNLGTILMDNGRLRHAVTCFQKAMETNPRFYAKAAERLASAQRELTGSPEQAVGASVIGEEPCR